MTALWLESAAASFEPPPDDAFEKIGYEPTPKQLGWREGHGKHELLPPREQLAADNEALRAEVARLSAGQAVTAR